MTALDHEDQLVRLASDAAPIYQDAMRWFEDQGAAAAPLLVQGLQRKELGSTAHWRILLLLRELRLANTLPAILESFHAALLERNPVVLPGAMEALAVFDSDEARAALNTVLASGDPDFVRHAKALLGVKAGSPDSGGRRPP
jgi:hypothetical protein